MRFIRLIFLFPLLVALHASNRSEPEGDWRGPLQLRITGQEFEWLVRYPGADGRLDTGDDRFALRDIHLSRGALVQIELTSMDYLYALRIPEFGVDQIAVPEMIFPVELRATQAGEFALRGDQFCGFAHKRLIGKVLVHEPDAYRRWVDRHATPEPPGIVVGEHRP